MYFREATIQDIPQIQIVRHSVHENRLSNPALVTDADCVEYLTIRGKGWVCEIDNEIVGFAIADLKDKNIWALFVDPQFENKGVGKQLQALMLHWYFSMQDYVWLSTAQNTRAEHFYTLTGWRKIGILLSGEVKFEMTRTEWLSQTKA